MGFGFIATDGEIDLVFNEFDADKSGRIDYKELNDSLRVAKGGSQRALKRAGTSRRMSVGGGMLTLDSDSDKTMQEQLREALTKRAVKILDLFRDWDEDGNGLVSQKEFRSAIAAMGVDAPASEVTQYVVACRRVTACNGV